VAALGQTPDGLTISPFSNAGAEVCSPGERIVSAKLGGGLASFSGSSMAAAYAAGVAALWAEKLSRDGRTSSDLLRARILAAAALHGLRPGYERFDTGLGLVRAPQA
jgi:subtilisin family serine protease